MHMRQRHHREPLASWPLLLMEQQRLCRRSQWRKDLTLWQLKAPPAWFGL